MYIEYAANIAYLPKNIPLNKIYTGYFALQDINGVINITRSRSFLDSKVRLAMIAGTVHPNPNTIGIKALPDNPNLSMISFITYATRAIYPLSSKKASAKNKMMIFGKKVDDKVVSN